MQYDNIYINHIRNLTTQTNQQEVGETDYVLNDIKRLRFFKNQILYLYLKYI